VSTPTVLKRALSVPDVDCAAVDMHSAAEWDGFVRSHRDAVGYHLWAWRNVFEKGLGHRCHYIIARRGPRVTGILPLVEIRSRLFGRALSSLPYVNYGGVLAEDSDSASALVDAASRVATDRRLSFVVLRHKERRFRELPARDHKVTMLLPLEKSSDAMWSKLDRKVRNQIRKAEKSSIVTEAGGAELLDEFYQIFARNMRDLGTPVYGRRLFAAILDQFPNDARIHLARLNGVAIAAALSYAYGDWIEVPSASSLREHRALCPNHLLYWSIIRRSIEQGRCVFDFGRSTPNDGTYHFKEQWGAHSEQLWWEYLLATGVTVPADDRHSSKYQAMIALWKRLPVKLVTFVGPTLARRIP
jgi:serine/alanine adding enzyme